MIANGIPGRNCGNHPGDGSRGNKALIENGFITGVKFEHKLLVERALYQSSN